MDSVLEWAAGEEVAKEIRCGYSGGETGVTGRALQCEGDVGAMDLRTFTKQSGYSRRKGIESRCGRKNGRRGCGANQQLSAANDRKQRGWALDGGRPGGRRLVSGG